jgi:hypothetical protein
MAAGEVGYDGDLCVCGATDTNVNTKRTHC